MRTTAKDWQFAKMAGLSLFGQDTDGGPEFTGDSVKFREYNRLFARDDRGEFYDNYPWKFPF